VESTGNHDDEQEVQDPGGDGSNDVQKSAASDGRKVRSAWIPILRGPVLFRFVSGSIGCG